MLKFLINFCLVNKNCQILVVVFVSKFNFSFRFHFVDENCGIFVVVVVFVTKIYLFSSTKNFVFVVVDEKTLLSICSPDIFMDFLQMLTFLLWLTFYIRITVVCIVWFYLIFIFCLMYYVCDCTI